MCFCISMLSANNQIDHQKLMWLSNTDGVDTQTKSDQAQALSTPSTRLHFIYVLLYFYISFKEKSQLFHSCSFSLVLSLSYVAKYVSRLLMQAHPLKSFFSTIFEIVAYK